MYNWANLHFHFTNNSLTSKGYEHIVHTWPHAALILISKQAYLLMTAHAENTVQFKVNDTDTHTVEVRSLHTP